MNPRSALNLRAVCLGAATSIALGAVIGSLVFNLFVRAVIGSDVPISKAYAEFSTMVGYCIFAVCGALVTGSSSGYVSAMLSERRKYLHAATTGLLIVGYSCLLYLTPISEVRLDRFSFILYFLVPVPSALLGAHIQVWRSADG